MSSESRSIACHDDKGDIQASELDTRKGIEVVVLTVIAVESECGVTFVKILNR